MNAKKTTLDAFLSVTVLAVGVLLMAAQVHAGTITWSGSTLIGDGTADISTLGTLVEAHNAGLILFPPPAITAGGVLFDNLEVNTLGGGTSGFNSANITGDANFDLLLDSASFSNVNTTYTIDGLVSGTPYLVQFFVADTRVGIGDVRTVTVDDQLGNTLTSGFINQGFAFTGLFTATGSTQNIKFSGDGLGTSPYINAWQLRDQTGVSAVPEPASFVLWLGLGFVALRKKYRRA